MKTQIKISKNSDPVNAGQKPMRQKSVPDVLQAYKNQTIQLKTINHTGLPDNLKSGVEHLSGLSMDNVRVHYNSDKPAQLQSLAYTQGTNIHVAPGQERHLPHEAWHVVQQMQGRVKPTTQLKGIHINDSSSLEQEAEIMGERAIKGGNDNDFPSLLQTKSTMNVIQMVKTYVIEDRSIFGKKKTTFLTKDARIINYRQNLKEEPKNSIYKSKRNKKIITRKEYINEIMDDAKLNFSLNIPDLIVFPEVPDLKETVSGTELNKDETLILVSHASMPMLFLNPTFGGFTPKSLAKKIKKMGIIPENYSGLMYINGCNTANGKKDYKDGTSFISIFKKEMKAIFKTEIGDFKVKGNLGEAETITDNSGDSGGRGKEKITFTKKTIDQLEERICEINFENQSDKSDKTKKIKSSNRAIKIEKMRKELESKKEATFIGNPGTYIV